MSKVGVKIKNWPFPKGEKVKLWWIGEPFKQNNKWMVNTYFKGNKATIKLILDWASIHFLSVDKYYTDGDLNNGEALENIEVTKINLTGAKVEYNERPWSIWGTGFKEETKSRTFNFTKNGVLYTIPIIEIVRAVLAPDKFMLNRILEVDTLENYFTYELQKNTLDIHFTAEYEKSLLKNEKISHLSWLITNPKIFKMFNSIGQNLWQQGELKFDFLFDKFIIEARVEKKQKYIRVLEIVSLKRKRINIDEVNIFHLSLEQTESTNEVKKRTFIGKNESSDRELDSQADGGTKASEEISTFLINHEYERIPRINKVKSGRKIRRKKEDESTQTYISEDNNLRTTADTGGEEIIKGLEFTNIAKIQEKGELQEFIEVLRLLEKRPTIKSVDVIVGELPEGRIAKRFSRLSDGVTKRKYVIGKINMVDGRECSLIEVEREDRALSMVLLKAARSVRWQWIYSILILELVNESGKWSNDIVEIIESNEIIVHRNKHIKKALNDKVQFIYEKLV